MALDVRKITNHIAGAATIASVIATILPSYATPTTAKPLVLASTRTAFVYPVMGPRMSSDFGTRKHPVKKVRRHHDGIDLAAPVGAPIRAIADGQVMYADPHGGYGRYVVIQHLDGFTSHYGHCEKLDVAPGQNVAAGQIIGTVGSSGVSTGPHLHFEIRRNGEARNPERYLPGLADQAAG
jgi:murein DD-endopeptidase MepM/ murein hydrolase activator NlpD